MCEAETCFWDAGQADRLFQHFDVASSVSYSPPNDFCRTTLKRFCPKRAEIWISPGRILATKEMDLLRERSGANKKRLGEMQQVVYLNNKLLLQLKGRFTVIKQNKSYHFLNKRVKKGE